MVFRREDRWKTNAFITGAGLSHDANGPGAVLPLMTRMARKTRKGKYTMTQTLAVKSQADRIR